MLVIKRTLNWSTHATDTIYIYFVTDSFEVGWLSRHLAGDLPIALTGTKVTGKNVISA